MMWCYDASRLPGNEVEVRCSAAGTPEPIVALLNTHLREIVATPEYRKLIEETGSIPESSTPAELSAIMNQTFEELAPTIKEFDLQRDWAAHPATWSRTELRPFGAIRALRLVRASSGIVDGMKMMLVWSNGDFTEVVRNRPAKAAEARL
jgi:hypothetical protein